MVKVKTYPNGLRVIVKEIEYVQSVTMGIMVGVGSAFETQSENGISHFIEHVNFKGTEKRTAFDISDEIDSIGAQINAFTSKDVTCYYVKCIRDHVEKSFEILSDIFLNSVYPKEELDKERTVIIEEINMTEDTPDDLCIDKLATAFFGDRGYGATILGPMENALRFSRDDIFNYRKKYYVPKNTVISFAGKVKYEEVIDMVDKYFADYQGESIYVPHLVETNVYTNDVCVDKSIEQVHFGLAIPSAEISSDKRYASLCLSSILGGGMSSRLFQSVREKRGLAYSVYSFMSSYKEAGVLYIYAGVNPKTVKSAYDCILEELNGLSNNGITLKELNRAKEQIKGSTALSSESTSSLMMSYGKRLLLTNDIFDVEKELNKLSVLTLEEVNQVAKERFNSSVMATSIVGKGVKPLR
ncbi:MAG: insulinase family protein [Clostridiales bacterium]|nr:insulinase family protein [Clostridiales bacterium]